jgi:uncharacterized membrane protein
MPKPRKPKSKKPKNFPPSLPERDLPSPPVAQVAVSRAAPLPHPSELEGYEAILPGSTERIFAMVENQSNHRRGLENRALALESRNSLFGLITGGIIGIVGLCIAGFCVYLGHDLTGLALGGGTLVSLVGPFIYGTHQRRIEREHKYLTGQNLTKKPQ